MISSRLKRQPLEWPWPASFFNSSSMLAGSPPSRNRQKVLGDPLIETLAKSLRAFARPRDQVIVNRRSDIHQHTIRVHVLRINFWVV